MRDTTHWRSVRHSCNRPRGDKNSKVLQFVAQRSMKEVCLRERRYDRLHLECIRRSNDCTALAVRTVGNAPRTLPRHRQRTPETGSRRRFPALVFGERIPDPVPSSTTSVTRRCLRGFATFRARQPLSPSPQHRIARRSSIHSSIGAPRETCPLYNVM